MTGTYSVPTGYASTSMDALHISCFCFLVVTIYCMLFMQNASYIFIQHLCNQYKSSYLVALNHHLTTFFLKAWKKYINIPICVWQQYAEIGWHKLKAYVFCTYLYFQSTWRVRTCLSQPLLHLSAPKRIRSYVHAGKLYV